MADIKCPKCEADITFDQVAHYKDGARSSVSITLDEGCLISAETLGQNMIAYARLIQEVARSMGTRAVVLVRGLSISEDGRTVTYSVQTVSVKGKGKRRSAYGAADVNDAALLGLKTLSKTQAPRPAEGE